MPTKTSNELLEEIEQKNEGLKNLKAEVENWNSIKNMMTALMR